MLTGLKKDSKFQFAVGIFSSLTVWWIFLRFISPPSYLNDQIFGATYGIMALYGGIIAYQIAYKWGYWKSLMGKSILLFATGLLAQEFGQISYSFYTYFLHREIPYPSIGDIGYFGSIPLYIAAVIYLGYASGAHLGIHELRSKMQAVLIPLAMLIFSYYYFLQGYVFDWSKPLVIFLDFGYPLGQAVYISIALLVYLLSKKVLGGLMKMRVLFILFALVLQYIADYFFLFESKNGTAYPGGINDYVYLVAYFVMTLALIEFKRVFTLLNG